MAEEKQCVIVLIGADEWGRKEIIGLADGYRESTQSWRELLLDLQRRGLAHAPDLAIGDGALGFWNALREVFGAAKEQRCWFHKTGNVLNAMPKSVQVKAKGHLHDIWQAETRVDAEAAFDFFVVTYGVKYDKAVAKLTKDRDVLLTFYDFPAEHWKHIRTTNPIESTFATVRHRTGKTKGCLSRKMGLAMAFKLMMSAACHIPTLKPVAKRLKERGKPHKLVIIAIARRLFTIANAIIKTGIPWQLQLGE
jgi:transposase-like protein